MNIAFPSLVTSISPIFTLNESCGSYLHNSMQHPIDGCRSQTATLTSDILDLTDFLIILFSKPKYKLFGSICSKRLDAKGGQGKGICGHCFILSTIYLSSSDLVRLRKLLKVIIMCFQYSICIRYTVYYYFMFTIIIKHAYKE